MSVKDLIWVNVAQALKLKQQYEKEEQLFKFHHEETESIFLTLCDLRDLALETHYYTKLHSLKDAKTKPFSPKELTSSKVMRKRKEDEKISRMSEKEQEEYEMQLLLNGEILS